MKILVSSWIVGFVFAIGLGISGMTQPQKVFGFLNLFGHWDPTLIFVMAGAIAVHFVAYRLIRRRARPVLSPIWHVPEKTEITRSLIVGSLIFGVGWGLGGYCPGPAIVALASFQFRPFLFVGAMILGMLVFKILNHFWKFNR